LGVQTAQECVDPISHGNALAKTDAERLRELLARVQVSEGNDEELSHDIWWELVDVPSGAAREIDGRREINIMAGEPALKPYWRALGSDYFADAEEKRLLIDSVDRAADLAAQALKGWKWQLYSGGGPDNDQCFACVHHRTGAFSAIADTLPSALIAAILKAKIAEAPLDEDGVRGKPATASISGLLSKAHAMLLSSAARDGG
jgi:hypothetical protein